MPRRSRVRRTWSRTWPGFPTPRRRSRAACASSSRGRRPQRATPATRVVHPTAAGALFAAHSWYVAPPPPPVAMVSEPVAPPKPVAPPLPFTYMGSYAPSGAKPVFFLTQGDRVYDVHIGDTLDKTYTVDAFTNGALVFTYKPLNQQQQLMTGGAP